MKKDEGQSLPEQVKNIAKDTRKHITNPGISPDSVQGCLAKEVLDGLHQEA